MKKNILCLIFGAIPFVFACNQSDKKAVSAVKDSVLNTSCYVATFEKDIASMQMNSLASGKVSGTLVVNYAEKPRNTGTIEGKFSGDTLLVDYRFKTGKDTVSVYTNPLAFLKKDGKLIMGVGQIETTLGRSYFVKGKPINYEVGKFTFEPKACK
ncbi:hypothetical protein EZJ43_07095 [Pedobacter changchengzhani]|uniref:Uncharacterized protein n=1 Tax=Pedobacter changchengzhani TaxID=2529274 RepID=A0A4V6PJ96_9SPHI|nr:hypothetical protein [Pedobacter changchengzhani]TDG37033.1 hypothetical protein EZJ43_07095 [Pedobacter changchengzhani]